ncbi:hypothetical protein JOB18_008361 [Solea senegalensis]|uniref:Uncharacterized protein n=1 Tax=Solea senegalensis TaxID=28829 RepID=A0AAV6QV09_SOLSE|nr:hypothetical protein JOB18_008361 [Solea senegalensis]
MSKILQKCYNMLSKICQKCPCSDSSDVFLVQDLVRISSKTGSSSMKLKIIPKVKKEREKLHKQKSNSSLSGTWEVKGGVGEADSSGN